MIEREIDIRTPDGVADARLIIPDGRGPWPAVMELTDGLGFRQEHVDIGARIAARGYVVLVPNVFYRTTKPPVFPFEPDFPSDRAMARFRELTGPLTPDAVARDASAYVDDLAARPEVS